MDVTEFIHLSKAPIAEALLDIKIRVKDTFDVSQLQTLHDSIKTEYPDKKTQHELQNKIEMKKGEAPISTSIDKITGYIFGSSDKKQIFQAKMNGFTFNRLSPYETWESFRSEAFRLWQIYSKLLSPVITRVAVRYINKFSLPLPIRDFNEYLVAAPIVPEGLPQAVSSFLNRVVIPFPDIEASAIVTQIFEQLEDPSLLPLILDIDVSKMYSKGVSEEDAWQVLDKFRDIKNQIFFGSVTPKAKELFL
jgi:uncharacterized protein (TIGR04255 family)